MGRKSRYPKLKNRPSGQVRHTHSVIAGVEDAIAILWEILDEGARAILVMQSKAKRAVEILKIVRSGPHSYKANNLRKDSDAKRTKNK